MNDPKYQFGKKDQLINREHGYIVDPDEPVFVLRAKDTVACGILLEYMSKCDEWHYVSASERYGAFREWQEKNPDRVGVRCNPSPQDILLTNLGRRFIRNKTVLKGFDALGRKSY